MALIKKFRIKSFKNPQPIISLDNISLSFGNRKILDNVSFKINHGQILGMLGPNGVGKSTIFNLITGLIKPDYGKINFNGTIVNDYPIYLRTTKFKIGYVPQYGGYFGDLTLLENLKAIAEIVILEKELIKNKIDAKIHVINFPEFIFEIGTVQHTNLIQLNKALHKESQRHDFHYIDMNSICMDFMKFQQSDQATVHRSLHHAKATLNALGQQFYTCGILENEQFIFPKKEVTL